MRKSKKEERRNDLLARKQADPKPKADPECSTGIPPLFTYLVSVCQGRFNFPDMIMMK